MIAITISAIYGVYQRREYGGMLAIIIASIDLLSTLSLIGFLGLDIIIIIAIVVDLAIIGFAIKDIREIQEIKIKPGVRARISKQFKQVAKVNYFVYFH